MSLHQFFGSILINSNLKDSSMKKQSLVALVTEELIKICKTEQGNIDMLAAKPILKSTDYILSNRLNEVLTQLKKDEEINIESLNFVTKDLSDLVKNLNDYIKNIK